MAIDTSYLLSNYQQSQKPTTGSSYLGKDAFLKLLITQLQNQDINNTMDDKEFIAQMAQFSSLEQMTNMTAAMEKLTSIQEENQLITYTQFVGKEVKWHKMVESENGSAPATEEGKGTISGVQYVNGSAVFTLNDGTTLTPGNISEVYNTGSGNSLVSASELIGKTVSWKDGGIESTASITSVSWKDGKIVYEMNDENKTKITAEQIVKIAS